MHAEPASLNCLHVMSSYDATAHRESPQAAAACRRVKQLPAPTLVLSSPSTPPHPLTVHTPLGSRCHPHRCLLRTIRAVQGAVDGMDPSSSSALTARQWRERPQTMPTAQLAAAHCPHLPLPPRQRASPTKGMFRFKNFHTKMSYRILRYMHRVLNIDEKKLITQLGEKSRDETFEPN